MADKRLVEYKGNIFVKFFRWVKSLFVKETDSEKNQDNNITTQVIKDKEYFFKVYNDAKNGKIDIDNLSQEEIIMLNKLLDEEISIKQDKLKSIKSNNAQLEKEIEEMEKENKVLLEKLGNTENY